jgi:predicted ATPase
VPLLAALLSLHLPPRYPPLALAPQQQKQRTIDILIRWLLQETARQPVLLVVEDLHWIDPSTLELLDALIDQVPSAALYVLGTCRPEFIAPWLSRTYCTQLTLTGLAPPHVVTMVTGITGGKRLPPAVVHQVARQTDGVPLFVEELTKMVLESPLLEEQADHYVLQQPLPALAIPTTLQDSLLARLDRLGTANTWHSPCGGNRTWRCVRLLLWST